MRKIVETNDASAIAGSNAIDNVMPEFSGGPVAPSIANVDLITGPLNAGHSELSFDLPSDNFTLTVVTDDHSPKDHASIANVISTDNSASPGANADLVSLSVDTASDDHGKRSHGFDSNSDSDGHNNHDASAPSFGAHDNHSAGSNAADVGISPVGRDVSFHHDTAPGSSSDVPASVPSDHDAVTNDPAPAPQTTASAPSTSTTTDGDMVWTLVGDDAGSTTTTTGTSTGTSTTTSGGAASAGLIINVNYDASVNSAPAAFKADVAAAVSYLQSQFSDPITITISVGYGEVNGQTMGGGALGQSMYYVGSFNYSQVKNALIADAKTADDLSANATLPTVDPTNGGTYYVASAEAKALGLWAGTIPDGWVGLSSGAAWDYNNADGVSPGTYDFYGTVLHEISEVLGRETTDGLSATYNPLDLFHYSAPGVRTFSGTTPGYFSVNNGQTNLNSFNTNPGGDFGDWAGNTPDAGNAYGSPGVVSPFSAADLTALDVIGWNRVSSGAPAAPTISSVSPDTGVAGDGITNASTLTLTGTAVASSTVNVYDGATLLGTATANASGAWTFTSGTLGNGAHSFTATDTVSGVTSSASTALNVTVDTVAPVAPTIATFSTDSGVVGDHITNDNTLTLTGTAEANSVVKVYDGATLLNSVTADGTGAWSYTTTALSNGAHSLTATATDAAGNTGVASSALAVTIDTTAPVAPTIATFSTDSGTVGDHITSDNTLTLTGTAEANSVVKVYDGATLLNSVTADGTGAWSYTTTALSNGAHSLTATATDAAGNTGVASAALSVTIDTTAPVAPTIATFSTDSGVVGDHITNDNTLTLTGTAEANSVVKVYDGATLLNSVTADGTGAWSYTTTALSNGAHSLTATATDAAGNTGVASSALAVTIDTTAPVAPTIATFSTDSGTVGDHITNDNTLTLTGTAEANSVVKVYDGATLLNSVTADGTGAWTYTTVALADGAHSLTATATDAAGNTGVASAALSVTVDTVAPTAPSISSDVTVNTNQIALTGTAEANSVVKVYDGATLLNSVTADGTGAWSYTTTALSNGAHNLTATATDVAGNTSAASGNSVTVDTVAPVAPTIATFSTDSGTVGDHITNDNTLTLTGTAEANSVVKVYDGATLLNSVTADGTGAWSYTTTALSNGAHSLTATATDAAGNTGVASSALAVTIDTTAPVAPTIATFSTDSGAVGDHITNDNTLTLTGTAEANSVVKVYDGATLLNSVTADGTGAWSYTTTALSNGAHSLTATATDAAGNTGVASSALAVTIDTTAPVAPTIATFSTDSGVVGDHITNDNTLTLTGTAEANSVVKVYDGATLLNSVTADGTGAWSYTTTALSNGAHSLTATATDAAGNTGVASSALAVTIDTTAPVAPTIATFSTDSGVVGDHITNDNTLTLTGTAEANSVVKVYDGATLLNSVTADGTGAWTYTTAALADGAHSLIATATDAAGNTGVASGALSVTVDTVAPTAPSISSDVTVNTNQIALGNSTTNDSTLTLTGTAEANAIVKVYDGATLLGSATSNVAGAWSYTAIGLSSGTHDLTATATDVAGNTSAVSSLLVVPVNTGASVIESLGSTSLVEVGTNFYLDSNSTGTGPSLKYGGADFVAGQLGGWTPIGTEQTATGYEVAWKATDSGQYSVWYTDNNGNYLSNAMGAVTGGSTTLQLFETSFHQDLDGDGTIGVPTMPNTDPTTGNTGPTTVIESFGSTSMVDVGTHFYLDSISTGTGPSLKYAGADVVAGQFGGWTPIGAEQTATGYEVAWKVAGSDQYGVWNTDSNGNYVSNAIGTVSGGSAALQSLEADFHQDLNGDGSIGVATTTNTPTVIESVGSTSLVEVGTNFYLDSNSTGAGPSLKYAAANFVTGQFGGWTPIGAEQTATGYEVAWKVAGSDQYGVWNTDSNGNYVSNAIGTLSGSNSAIESIETSFLQDINGNGLIGGKAIVNGTSGNDTLTSSSPNQIFFGNGGNNTFVFSGIVGNDIIADFHLSDDAVQLSKSTFATFADVMAHAAQVGSDVTITIDTADSVTLHNTAVAQLTSNNFHLV